MESAFPLLIERSELVPDSGGIGKFRGGLASRLQFRMLAPAVYYVFIEKGKSLHWGCAGGGNGLRNYALVMPQKGTAYDVLKNPGITLSPGDCVAVVAGGGGGYGSPLERDMEKVRSDVIEGYVSIERARQDYGVVIDSQTFAVDVQSTLKLRDSFLKSNQGGI
jgi:N-methylhydantoinase B